MSILTLQKCIILPRTSRANSIYCDFCQVCSTDSYPVSTYGYWPKINYNPTYKQAIYTKTTVTFALFLLISVMARAAIVKIIWLFCRFRERRREKKNNEKQTNLGEHFLEENLPQPVRTGLLLASISSLVWKKNGVWNSEIITYKLTFGRTYLHFGIDYIITFHFFCGRLELNSAFL